MEWKWAGPFRAQFSCVYILDCYYFHPPYALNCEKQCFEVIFWTEVFKNIENVLFESYIMDGLRICREKKSKHLY